MLSGLFDKTVGPKVMKSGFVLIFIYDFRGWELSADAAGGMQPPLGRRSPVWEFRHAETEG